MTEVQTKAIRYSKRMREGSRYNLLLVLLHSHIGSPVGLEAVVLSKRRVRGQQLKEERRKTRRDEEMDAYLGRLVGRFISGGRLGGSLGGSRGLSSLLAHLGSSLMVGAEPVIRLHSERWKAIAIR